MLKHFTLSVLLITLFTLNNTSQTVRFVGMTSAGGATDGGTIFETDAQGNFKTVLHSFLSDQGRLPQWELLEASNGKLYGVTIRGGKHGFGGIYEYDPATNEITKKADFSEQIGTSPVTGLIQASNGKLYGITQLNGQYGLGTIYEYDLLLNTISVRHHFNPFVGGNPRSNLIQFTNGKIYGTTTNGGINSIGFIFEFDPITFSFTPKIDLEGTTTGRFDCRMTLATNGKIYGSMSVGGVNNAGVIFEYTPSSNSFSKLFDFDRMITGSSPNILLEASNGLLYSTTRYGGVNDHGILFSYDIINDTLIKHLDFNVNVNGYNPIGRLLQLSNGKIYGVSNGITGFNYGQLFEYDYFSDTISRVFPFHSSNHGWSPNLSLTLSSGKIFGTTSTGGSQNMGTFFEFDPTNDTIIKKQDFSNSPGWKPYGNITSATNGNYYGTTVQGGKFYGNSELGTIFSYNPNTGIYSKVLDFEGSGKSKSAPEVKGNLMEASNGKLYGMYPSSVYSGGYLYKYDTSIDTVINTLDFASFGKTMSAPEGVGNLLEASNGKLYGMYPIGGGNNAGYIYEYDTTLDTISHTVDFDFVAGGKVNINPNPEGTLIEATNGKLYGMTKYGGTGLGSLIEYDIIADTLKEKINFNGTNGLYPKGDLVQASNGKLYGMTPEGGANGFGVLFEYDTIGTLVKKIDFDSVNTGAFPHGNLIEAYNGKLYGMTSSGGANGLGVIFEYDTSGVLTKLVDFDGTNGAKPFGSLLEIGSCESYSSISPTVCDSYASPSGKVWTSANTYLDTLYGANILGCDSIITINLTLNNSSSSTETVTACESYVWFGNTYSTSGTYFDTIPNALGCDSLMSLNLTINNSNSGSQSVTACNSYIWSANNTSYTSSGSYTAVLTNAAGCDSTATLNLTINNSTSSTETVTACDSYLWLGNTYTTTGTYLDTIQNAMGCDSLMSLNLTINNSNSGSQSITACNSYIWSANNTSYTSNGSYTAVLTNAAGCDSTATLNLAINNSTSSITTVTACDSYMWLGNNYTVTGTYLDTIQNAMGCDSLMSLNLTINNSNSGSQSITACNSYTWSANNMSYTSSGSYTAVLTNAAGCDSTATLNLTINNSTSSITNVTACGSYMWLGNTYSTSGTFLDTIPNAVGCDSLMSLNLTINNSNSGSQSVTACNSYTWSANNTSYTSSGSYTTVLTNAAGCDSTATLNLTINNSTSSITTVTACDSYMWLGNNYTVTGTYLDTIQNAVGCDSLMSLNLTINNSNSGSQSVIACNSYTWSANNTSYTSSGSYTAVLTNAAGCDSTATLNLTINNSTSSITTVTACDSYVWLGNTYTATGTFLDTIPNAMGCDSLMSLNLTINNSNSGSQSITACNSYIWSANNTSYTSSGSYTAVLTNAAGCDSTATLNLTINNSTSSTETVTACDSYLWLGNTYTTTGTYLDTIQNTMGCDSLMSLNLNITTLDVTITDNSPTLTANTSNSKYQWIDCNNGFQPLIGDTNQSFSASTNGSYAVIITENSCSDTSACYSIINVGISDIQEDLHFSIVPNPTRRYVTVGFGRELNNASIKIFDTQGKVILYSDNVNEMSKTFNLENFSKGLYFLMIEEKGKVYTSKIVRQ